MPLVSVIVPVYQVKIEYLRECLDSLVSQSLKDIEIIVVSDGAKDELIGEIESYAEKDERIRFFAQENMGASSARNLGLANAQGTYVTFVDSDDYINRVTLEEALTFMKRNRLQLLLWGSYKCYEKKKEKYMPYTADITCFSARGKQQLMMKTMVGHLPFYDEPASVYGSGSCCSKLYLRSLLTDNNLSYPEGVERAEDVNFNIRVFNKARKIGYLNKHFYYYRQVSNSATYKYRENGICVFTAALECLREFIENELTLDNTVCEEENREEVRNLFNQVFYMRCMFFLLESLDMDYLNERNIKPLNMKLSALKRVIQTEPYKTAIGNLSYGNLTFARKIPLFLLKRKWVGILALFYTLYGKTKR